MYIWRSLYILYLFACQVRITVCDSGLCCCVCVMSFDGQLTLLRVDSVHALWASLCSRLRAEQSGMLMLCTVYWKWFVSQSVMCVCVPLLPNQSLDSSSFSLGSSLGVKTFSVAASRLLAAVARSIQQCLPLQRESYPPNLETEWKEFFAEGVYSFLFPLFIRSIGMKLHHYMCANKKSVILSVITTCVLQLQVPKQEICDLSNFVHCRDSHPTSNCLTWNMATCFYVCCCFRSVVMGLCHHTPKNANKTIRAKTPVMSLSSLSSLGTGRDGVKGR